MGIIDAGVALERGTALKSWGKLVGQAAEAIQPSRIPNLQPLEQAGTVLARTSEDLIRTSGWEVKHAFPVWDHGLCVFEADFAAMSLAERVHGTIPAALQHVGTADARTAALAVAYDVSVRSPLHPFGNPYTFHAGALSRTLDDKYLVTDALVAPEGDGVLPLEEWLRRIGGSHERTRIMPVGYAPPPLLNGNSGIGVFAKRMEPSIWEKMGNELAAAWQTFPAPRVASSAA